MLDILRACIQYVEDNGILFGEEEQLIEYLALYVKAFPQLNGRVKKLKRKFPRPFFNYTKVDYQLFR